MLSLRFAEYINVNMKRLGWKLKDLERESGVSDSTIAAYRKGKSETPAKDNMYRIAAAFGDPPSVIDEMCEAAIRGSDDEQRRLTEEAEDNARIARIVEIMKETMIQIMDDFHEKNLEQQTEILRHADNQVAEAEAGFKRRVQSVLTQCQEEVQREKDHCQTRIDDIHKFAEFIYHTERAHNNELSIRNVNSRDYLKSIIRNISVCCILLGMIAFFTSGYAIFAFFAFDMPDPSRGIYQGSMFAAVMIFACVVLFMLFIVWRLYILYRRREQDAVAQKEDASAGEQPRIHV